MTTYRTSGAWGAGKGANLTAAEVDENFYELAQALADLEDDPPTADEISNITVDGSQLTIHLASGTTFGPFTLPKARFVWRNDWLPSTSYAVNDVFKGTDGNVYFVSTAHVSASTFAVTGSISLMMEQPVMRAAPIKNIEQEGGTYELVDEDALQYLRIASETITVVVAIPPEIELDIPIGDEIHFRQVLDGQIEFEADVDVTVDGMAGFNLKTIGRGAVATLKKVGVDAWELFGALEEEF